MTLATIRIILVEPLGALNVGSVARVMKNMGLSQLVLVNPQCDPDSEPAQQMAVHGRDVLAQAVQVASLPEALQGCQRAIATTMRDRATSRQESHYRPRPLESPRQVLPWLLAEPMAPGALIFGREDRGLSNAELDYAPRWLGIPTHAVYPSLNLAQAVAICAYELYQLTLEPTPAPSPLPETGEPASLDALEDYYQHLEHLLLHIGYLYPHTAAARLAKLRRIGQRASLSAEEVALLRGMLRQVEWAIAHADRLPLDEPTR
ncbi:MAG: RNA methyltransferase [Spirulinaceae cyanobacterium SM2_1_0]|nr:RNA methyltransferase [Spirulinaceae cyanobacterium SM2_1_0]